MTKKQIYLIEKLYTKHSDEYIAEILGVKTSEVILCRKKNGFTRELEMSRKRGLKKISDSSIKNETHDKYWYKRELKDVTDVIERIEKTLMVTVDYEKYMQMSKRLSILMRRKLFIENILTKRDNQGIPERSSLPYSKYPLGD